MKGLVACGFDFFRGFPKVLWPATESMPERKGWIGVDFDGTLAEYHGYRSVASGHMPAPIMPMVNRVKEWLLADREVKIFTARVCSKLSKEQIREQKKFIEAWCEQYIGTKLDITNEKDFFMVELWDNIAVGVIENKGIPLLNP